MTLSVSHATEEASPLRGLLPLWVGAGIYALFLAAGNRLLIDPDTLWQITVGQWIIDHRAVPQTDVYSFTMRGQPWISTQWLAQVMYAKAYAAFGWSGPVVLAAGAIAATFALLAKFLSRRLGDSTTLVFVAAALALTVPHLLARPHVLALPVMVAWVGGMIAAADRRAAPSFWLLPLMALWANLHGGFVFGLVLTAPIALDAVVGAEPRHRRSLILRWAGFGLAALLASFATPYGWNALLASRKILELGGALPLIMEWKPADFGSLGALEVCLLLGVGLALYRGIRLPPLRIVLLLGLCTWRSRKAAPAKSWHCWGRWCSPHRWRGRSAARSPRIRTPPRRCAECCSRPPRSPCWRERLSMRRCIGSRRTPAARRSPRWPR